MKCLRAQEEISRAFDDEQAVADEVARHLASCEDCAGFRDVSTAFARRYRESVRRGVDCLKGREDAPASRARPGLLAAVLAAAVLLVVGFLSQPSEQGLARKSIVPEGNPVSARPTREDAALFPEVGAFLEESDRESWWRPAVSAEGDPLLLCRLWSSGSSEIGQDHYWPAPEFVATKRSEKAGGVGDGPAWSWSPPW
jgi:hypothetical protein